MLGAPLSSFVQDQWKRSVSDGEAALASAVAELRDVVRGHLSSILSIAEARRLLLELYNDFPLDNRVQSHRLEEIRVRALKSILTKLEHDLLCDADLIQEKYLHIQLLEWFNLASCPMVKEVLQLIKRLTKHQSAAQIYMDLGAIEFFSQLRSNLDQVHRPLIDAILDQLFHLPSTAAPGHIEHCVYKQQPPCETPKAPAQYLDSTVQSSSTLEEGRERSTEGKFPSPPDSRIGYFRDGPAEGVVQVTANCFRFATFPWITLTPTDKHVLSSTDNSLRSSDPSLVVCACEFLSDVVFQDFPAEVFLQRPVMIKSLLSLLTVPTSENVTAAVNAACTLHDLAQCIQMRIFYYQDPSVYSPKQDFSSSANSSSSFLSHSLASTDSRPSVVGHSELRPQGDGQDGDNSSAGSSFLRMDEYGERTDVDEIQTLQFMQWSIPQYCMAVMDKILPCLKSSHEEFIVHALQLLHQVTVLLKESVDVQLLWTDQSIPAREMVEKFIDCLEMLGDILYLHHHSNLNSSTPSNDITRHRVSFASIASYVCDLLSCVVPEDLISSIIPKEFIPVLSMMIQDDSLSYSYPSIRRTCLKFLAQLDLDAFNSFSHALEICQSLRCKRQSANPNTMQDSKRLVLTLLSHPVESIRTQAYEKAEQIVKEALGVEHVTEPTSSAASAIAFLVDRKMLYQIITFGMNDSEPKVVSLSSSILVHLLQSELLLPSSLWKQFLQSIIPLMAALQSHCNKESTLGGIILSLASTEGRSELPGVLPFIERFRGALRLLLSADKRLRADGLGRLAYFLAHEEDSLHKVPLFSEMDLTNLSALFVMETPRSLIDDDLSPSVFNAEGLQKVLAIFSSKTLDASVRKSASEQLAIMLQDPRLHALFVQSGGLAQIQSYMKLAVMKNDPDEEPRDAYRMLLPTMTKMLRCLVQADFSLRHKLAHEASTYFTILRGVLLHATDWEARKESAELMTFLLFDELSSVDTWSFDERPKCTTFSLPQYIIQKYRLPFKPQGVIKCSPHAPILPPEPDPLKEGDLAEMLRLTWNISWHSGIECAIRDGGDSLSHEAQLFSSRLQLTSVDLSVLEVSYLDHGVQKCIHGIQNATSHHAVSEALCTLKSQLLIGGPSNRAAAMETLQKFPWRSALERFLQVAPSSTDDEQLLADVLSVFSMIVSSDVPEEVLNWMGTMAHLQNGAFLNLLMRSENTQDLPEATLHVRRMLNRQLLKFIQCYVAKCPFSLSDSRSLQRVRGELANGVLSRIHRPGTVQSYNLPSLEATLTCLMHITARTGWSVASVESDSLNLCQQMLQCLLEVVSAFHIGRGGMSMSFMGRGVTRSSTLCLRHLALEMHSQLHSKDWPRNWLHSREATPNSVGESGFHWLIPLWTYRDTEVRAAGFGIATALASTESGRITLATQCQHIPGGIWGAAFSLLLDQSECSLVREQAAHLLVNLTSKPLPTEATDSAANVWQGPIVQNEDNLTSLVGLPALQALLQFSQFFPEMVTVLAQYYSQPAIHPVSIAGQSSFTTPTESQLTMTTNDSASHSTDRPSQVGGVQIDERSINFQNIQIMTSTPQHHILQSADTNASQSASSTVPDASGVQASQPSSPLSAKAAVSHGNAASESHDSHGPEYPSVATPCLIAAVAKLLSNLIAMSPKDMIASIQEVGLHSAFINLLDAGLLEAYCTELKSTEYKKQFLIAFGDLLRCHANALDLVTQLVVLDPAIRGQLLQETNTWKQIVKLLGISYTDDSDSAKLCEDLWERTLSLFAALLQADSSSTIETLGSIFDEKETEPRLMFSCHIFVSLLFSEEGRLISKIGNERKAGLYLVSDHLDKTKNQGMNGANGGILCGVLIKNFHVLLMKPMERFFASKSACVGALKALLAVSTAAKTVALEGLLMNLQALDFAKPPANKKRNPLMIEMHQIIDVLRNFMFENLEVKMAAYEYGLGNMVHKIWAWCQMDSALMLSVLALLATFASRCPQACSSLAVTSPHDNIDKPGLKGQYSNSSLVHCLMKVAQKEASNHGNATLLRKAFSVLSTLALSQECSGILWKSNFLHEFSALAPKKSRKSKNQQIVENLWLELMVNLSFSTEGQNLIMKINDSVDLLVEFGLLGHDGKQKNCVLIIRNLCFHTTNKTKLLANDKVLPFLLRCLEAGGSDVKSISCSALLALVYNSQKAKGVLKNAHVMRKLEEAHKHLTSLAEMDWAQVSAANLQSVTYLLKA
ncbi:hypothetical protein CAPTEDRAFT_220120 [Capitella teleta]|uniref:Rotatin N-terminal domain-containing protein n=1 Tax=Capitella teleta TaxID=283909 RepID=R7UTB4_CAPTE|nr:hypothetical protein CAPTEDRAFT_220120 [Capitella teleta]|eukprot:ELU06616.1 hypothetical protein CAPTEDRAFT_220120 [Capitella teleta]